MKKIILSNGLDVHGGRLMNNRPDGRTGIQMVSEARQMRKREQKISMMEEAMYRAEMKSDMSEYMMGSSCR
jgi:hypothetical protein